jgi:hypothetical protein
MLNVTATLGEFLQHVASVGGMSDGDVVKLIKLTRQLLEKKRLKHKYSVLNFYCNWCFHVAISGSTTPCRMLDAITDVFISDDGSKRVDIPQEVSQILSLAKLRSDFVQLYRDEGLPIFLFDDFDNWWNFVSQLLKEIMHKPIQFPEGPALDRNKQAKQIADGLAAKAGDRPAFIAKSLWLSDTEEGKKGEVWWLVETVPQVRICGRLMFTERLEDFRARR